MRDLFLEKESGKGKIYFERKNVREREWVWGSDKV